MYPLPTIFGASERYQESERDVLLEIDISWKDYIVLVE
jgi:hypothetical protein